MKILNLIILLLADIVFLRTSLLVLAKIKKINKNDSILFGQKLTAILSGILLLGVLYERLFLYFGLVILFLDFLFYLQPTPRVTKLLINIFIVVNLTFLFLALFKI